MPMVKEGFRGRAGFVLSGFSQDNPNSESPGSLRCRCFAKGKTLKNRENEFP
jgi:hypothetical protein